MRFTDRRFAAASLLLLSLLSSCGKKEEAPPPPAPQQAAPTAKAEAPPVPASIPAAPQAKESPPATTPVATPAPAAAGVEQVFSGTIGGQPVMVQLSVKQSGAGSASVNGTYFLESQGTSNKIPLSGRLEDGNLVLEQTVQGAVTGTFDLLQDGSNKSVYLGSWKGLGRVLPVKLVAAP